MVKILMKGNLKEMNKKEFQKHLKNKEFDNCIEMLRKDIILKLEKKIKENDSYFSYSTTKDLYNASKKYLSEELSTIAYQLYSFDIMPEREEYVLDEMLYMYKKVTKL